MYGEHDDSLFELHFKSEEDDLHRKLPGRGIYCEEAIAGRYWYSAAGDFNMSAVVEVQSFLANITSYWLMAQVFHEPKVAIRPFWTITGRQCGVEMTCDRLGCPDAVTNLPDHFNAVLLVIFPFLLFRNIFPKERL